MSVLDPVHVRRHDLWVNLLQRFAEAILFFNPAMWWLSRRVSVLREYCCDDCACKVIPENAQPELLYAQALLHVVELQHPGYKEQVASLAVSGRSPSELRRRVARLFGETPSSKIRPSGRSIAVLIAGIALLLLVSPMIAHSTIESPAPTSVVELDDQPDESNDKLSEPPAKSGSLKATAMKATVMQPNQISGVVLNPDGKPVADASCQLIRVSNPKAARGNRPISSLQKAFLLVPGRLSTDAQGRFEFSGLSEGKYQLEVRGKNLCGVRTEVLTLTKTGMDGPLSIRLSKGRTVIAQATTLRDGKRSSVAGMLFYARSSEEGLKGLAPGVIPGFNQSQSDNQGAVKLTGLVPGTTYYLGSSSNEWLAEKSTKVVVSETGNIQEVEIRMSTEGIVRGVVLDEAGNPVAGAKVTPTATHSGFFANRRPIYKFGLPLDVVTDAKGRFQMGKLNAKENYHLVVHADGYAPKPTDAFSASAGESQKVILDRGATLRGHVVDADSGDPVAGIKVRVTPIIPLSNEPSKLGDLEWIVTTDREGNFSIPNMANTSYNLTGVWTGENTSLAIAMSNAVMRHGADETVELRAYNPVTIRGVVKDRLNKPLAGAKIEVRSNTVVLDLYLDRRKFTATSDEQGQFEIKGLSHGELSASVSLEGYLVPESHSPDRTISASQPGEVIENEVFKLEKDPATELLSLQGMVLDPEKKPVGNAGVSLYYVIDQTDRATFFRAGGSTATDKKGHFSFSDERGGASGVVVMPTEERPFYGNWEIDPLQIELNRSLKKMDMDPSERKRLLNAIKQSQASVKLERCGSAGGVVVDSLGKPISGVSVVAHPKARFVVSSEEAPTSVETDAKGRFRFPFLRPGQCRFSFYKKEFGRRSARHEVKSGENTELSPTLVVANTQKFRGRLVDTKGRPLANWRVASEMTAKDGTFEYQLKTGSNRIHFHYERGNYQTGTRVTYQSGPIEFPKQKPQEVQDFVVHGGGKIRGKLTIAETGKSPRLVQGELEINYKKRQKSNSFGKCTAKTISIRVQDLLQPDGSFELRDVPVGHCVLRLSGEEISETTIPVNVDASGTADLKEIRRPQGRQLIGTLVGPDGKPVNGSKYKLKVEGRLNSGKKMRSFFGRRDLDYKGRFRISSLPQDVERLTLLLPLKKGRTGHPARVAFLDKLDMKTTPTLDLKNLVARHYQLSGRLLDKATGKPIEKAAGDLSIIARAKNVFESYYYNTEFKRQPDKRFVLPNFRPDFEELEFKLKGYIPVQLTGPPKIGKDGLIDVGDVLFEAEENSAKP